MATINPDIEAVEDKLKSNEQPQASLRQARVKERNIVSVKAKKDQPQFIYNRVYVSMQRGKCLEYNLGDDTSLLTRDERFQEFMVRPYAVIPINHKEESTYQLISPKWTGFRMVGLSSIKEYLDLSPRYSSIKILQNGDYIVGNHLELEDAWARYRGYLLSKWSEKLTSNQCLVSNYIISNSYKIQYQKPI
jgi:hypothetical protein